MKILVTGANGLLGHHVVMKLLDSNEQVHIIVRNTDNIYFDLERVNVFTGNFTNFQHLKEAADGCDAVIHCAAVTATDLLHYADYEKVNVGGSANVIEVAGALNIHKIVFVSSSNTVGYGNKEKLADEDTPFQFPFTKSFYAKSKLAAEKLFIEYSRKAGKHVCIINSCFLIGGFDTKNGSGRLIKSGNKKPFLILPKGGKNFVPAEKVAEAVCNAVSMGKNGEKYLVCGENLSFRQFFERLKLAGKYRQIVVELPDRVLILAGRVGDWIRKLGFGTSLCTTNVRQLLVQEYYSGKKADKELILKMVDLDKSIHEALSWEKSRV